VVCVLQAQGLTVAHRTGPCQELIGRHVGIRAQAHREPAAGHGGPCLVQLVAGAEYRAPLEGTWLTYLYWVGFLALAWGVGALFTWLWQKLLSNSTISRGPIECVLALMSGRG